jgi:hypothetical protein
VAPADVEGALDTTALIRDPRNVVLWLADGSGGFIFEMHCPGAYEVHSQFLSAARSETTEAAREALQYIFTATDAVEVVTKAPRRNVLALALAKAVGFRSDFVRPAAWGLANGDRDDVEHLLLTWRDWVRSTPGLAEAGELFHNRLELLLASGVSHGADPYHNRVVGATLAGLSGGQLDKSLTLYNRWARTAGYAQIGLLSRTPLVVDIVDAVLVRQDDGSWGVLLDRTALAAGELKKAPGPSALANAINDVLEAGPPPLH